MTSASPPADDAVPPRTALEELELVRRALAGDPAARTALSPYFAKVPRIVAALCRQSGTRLAPQDQEDVVQDCQTLLWRKLPDFAGRARLTTWLFRVVGLELKNALRRVAKRKKSLVAPDPGDREEPLSSADDPSRRLGTLAAEELLARLEPTPMEVVRRRHWEEQTFEEIATVLGMKVSQAKSLYYRALVRLHGFLTEPGAGGPRG